MMRHGVIHHLVSLWMVVAWLVPQPNVIISAYPTRAGHCQTGPSIGEASGGVHGRLGSGTLEDGGYSVSINKTILVDGDALVLGAGVDYDIAIKGKSTFLGFLLRVSGMNGEKLQESLVVVDDLETQLLPSTGENTGFDSACAKDVAGLSHNSRKAKKAISAGFLVQDEADIHVEVTIVNNNEGGGSNDWYYSSYQVEVRVVQQDENNTETDTESVPDRGSDGGSNGTSSGTSDGGSNGTSDGESSAGNKSNSTESEGDDGSSAGNKTNSTAFEGHDGSSTGNRTNSTESEGDVGNEAMLGGKQEEDKESESPPVLTGGCKWFCDVIPIPWVSEEPDYAKCSWQFSCSECPKCKEGTQRRK